MASPAPAAADPTAVAAPSPIIANAKLPPLLRLPSELLLRIIACVACFGRPSDLAHLAQTSAAFYVLLADKGLQNEQQIWRRAAAAILGECTPTSLEVEPTWEEFLKRAWCLSRSDGRSDEVRELAAGQLLHTSPEGLFPSPTPSFITSIDHDEYRKFEMEMPRAEQHLPPVPKGATRIIDFVHSGTEGIRAEPGTPYCGANSGLFFTFSDDDPSTEEEPSKPMKGFVMADKPYLKGRDVLVTGGVQDNTGSWITNTEEVYDTAELNTYFSWLRSCVHSDANLNLIPAVVPYQDGATSSKIAVIAKAQRYYSPDIIEKEWTFDTEPATWSAGARAVSDLSDDWQGPWGDNAHWEFRSAGDYLVMCDDNHGEKPSTVSCFVNSRNRPFWQRRMVVTDSDNDAMFWDNDGVRMSTAFVVYASRSRRPNLPRHRARDDPSGRDVMEFILLSTKTGDILRVLDMSQENRPTSVLRGTRLCLWCSFIVTDTMIVATVGGRVQEDEKYQYLDALIWDLTVTSHTGPTHAIQLPKIWSPSAESYVAISPDGRWLGVQVGWDLGVWDLLKKTQVRIWRVARSDRYESDHWTLSERVTGWNGIWVKYRDIFEEPPSPEGNTDRLSSSDSFYTDPEDTSTKERHGVAYITTRILRRIKRLHASLRILDNKDFEETVENPELTEIIYSDSSDGEIDDDRSDYSYEYGYEYGAEMDTDSSDSDEDEDEYGFLEDEHHDYMAMLAPDGTIYPEEGEAAVHSAEEENGGDPWESEEEDGADADSGHWEDGLW